VICLIFNDVFYSLRSDARRNGSPRSRSNDRNYNSFFNHQHMNKGAESVGFDCAHSSLEMKYI